MGITIEDRYAVLEERLKVAESAIYGCRAMLDYVRRLDIDVPTIGETESKDPRRAGLYDGQVDNYVSPPDCDKPEEEECVE